MQPIIRARHVEPASQPATTVKAPAAPAAKSLSQDRLQLNPLTSRTTAVVPEPSADKAAPRPKLLKRLTSSTFAMGVTQAWQKKNPWVHERLNARQVDPSAQPVATAFSTDARAVFGQVDADRDGTLSTKELIKAMGSPDIKRGEAAAVGAMYKYVDEIEDLSNDERSLETKGITRKDLDHFDRLKGDSDLGSTVRGNYYWGLSRITSVDRRLYADDKAVRGTAVEQGSLGDCYFLAGLTGLADAKPDAIKKMITENQDGTYTVRFPGRKPVTVTAPTDAEISLYVSSGRNGIWLNVLEKAYAKSRNDSRLFAKGDMYKAIEGGWGRQSIKALTGNASDVSRMRFLSPAKLQAKVMQAQADGRLMTIATGHPFGRSETKANKLPTGHEYTVLGYDEASGKYRIRNPWGSGGDRDDGMLELTAAEVKANFANLTIEKRKSSR